MDIHIFIISIYIIDVPCEQLHLNIVTALIRVLVHVPLLLHCLDEHVGGLKQYISLLVVALLTINPA